MRWISQDVKKALAPDVEFRLQLLFILICLISISAIKFHTNPYISMFFADMTEWSYREPGHPV